ncbi:hypothetical protein F4827_005040 [Paraburkholderia bannensis]|uniref:Uncharacterized protein n=1 Tax=Paraburkholderia bannensis TaxID=765414 RepID=A0A7W9U1H6_9BURK|nr:MULTISPECIES: hypothetical protein [Paraburkholderia]MBB3259968.1 hypothetical protein [Paraburkholderia sp. WP4_3_2]MBB6105174.1 hypothetical protein [Paraburkholderia bannensis]
MDVLSMIELAAEAANFEHRRYRVRDIEAIHVRACGSPEWRFFNPLVRDSDAAELGARLRIDVLHFATHVTASAGFQGVRHSALDEIGLTCNHDDEIKQRRRAARRAVTECAARAGKTKRGAA